MRATRILILRFSSIGDIVLTTPVIRQLDEQLDGEVEIHYLTKKAYGPLLASNPHVHTLHTFEKDLTEVFDELMELEFDYIVDLHGNLRSSIAKRKLKKLSFTINKRNRDKWLLVRFGIDKLQGQHIVERYLETVKGFKLEDDMKGLDLFIPEDQSAPALPSGFENGYALIAVGAAHEGKQMSQGQMSAIADLMKLPVVLIGGKDDRELAERIEEASVQQIWNGCGKTSLMESAALIRDAKVVIAGDTGMMHIAAALNVPLISVWGCTSPAIGMAPWRPHPRSVIIEPEGRPKRPCSKLGNRCKYNEKKCIDTIDPGQIANIANKLLN